CCASSDARVIPPIVRAERSSSLRNQENRPGGSQPARRYGLRRDGGACAAVTARATVARGQHSGCSQGVPGGTRSVAVPRVLAEREWPWCADARARIPDCSQPWSCHITVSGLAIRPLDLVELGFDFGDVRLVHPEAHLAQLSPRFGDGHLRLRDLDADQAH